MTTASLTDRDISMKDAVMRQLDCDPRVDASAVGVAANNGAVTLTGYVDTYFGKLAAERAAKRVRGVRAVANDIEVRLKLERVDSDIASDVVRALELHGSSPDTVQAAVHSGYVTLTGKVSWMYQKRDAEKVVRHRIVEALHRNANLDARHISIRVSGNKAILTGTVGSWLQRESAERAAGDAPGIAEVENRIVVQPRPGDFDELC